jgi:CubicO group peptidase (beta-lactamase class C family)
MKNLYLLVLLVITSCSLFTSKDLVKLPVTNNPNSLDSSQAQAVYDRVKYYPNGTQLSICIIKGGSEKYVGIERRNDSLVYINNSDSVFEIGSITKTFTGTMLAKLVYEGKVKKSCPFQCFRIS